MNKVAMLEENRVTIRLPEMLVRKIDAYWINQPGIVNRTTAIRLLLQKGLEVEGIE